MVGSLAKTPDKRINECLTRNFSAVLSISRKDGMLCDEIDANLFKIAGRIKKENALCTMLLLL